MRTTEYYKHLSVHNAIINSRLKNDQSQHPSDTLSTKSKHCMLHKEGFIAGMDGWISCTNILVTQEILKIVLGFFDILGPGNMVILTEMTLLHFLYILYFCSYEP